MGRRSAPHLPIVSGLSIACLKQYQDQVGLMIATAFGALLGLVNGYSRLDTSGSTYSGHSSAQSLLAGRSIIIGLFGSLNAFPRLGPTPCASYRLLAM